MSLPKITSRASRWIGLLAAACVVGAAAPAPAPVGWVVKPEWVAAHEAFLASDDLKGRGSGTADEARAAAYVADQFKAYGLKTAPGMSSYVQAAALPVRPGDTGPGRTTTNAVGYLPGTDPKAGVILYSAHLDHLGVRNGVIMHGANDDASGVTAVLELAHALAAGPPTRRSVLFVAYGSEETGGQGSRWFADHPPVPLDSILINIEFEMIGAQDPKLPAGALMMTGFERSDLGEALKAHGALVAPDPYPEQNFFRRSDNYSLALKGVVAHTLSGWAVVPTYHTAQDDIAHLDLKYMTAAIQSLIEPARWLADSEVAPKWKPGGQPKP